MAETVIFWKKKRSLRTIKSKYQESTIQLSIPRKEGTMMPPRKPLHYKHQNSFLATSYHTCLSGPCRRVSKGFALQHIIKHLSKDCTISIFNI